MAEAAVGVTQGHSITDTDQIRTKLDGRKVETEATPFHQRHEVTEQ
jgi:hypothetical protein